MKGGSDGSPRSGKPVLNQAPPRRRRSKGRRARHKDVEGARGLASGHRTSVRAARAGEVCDVCGGRQTSRDRHGDVVAQAQTVGPGLASDLALAHGSAVDLGALLPAWSALPFAGILLSIALCPLLVPQLLAPPLRQGGRRLGARVRRALRAPLRQRRAPRAVPHGDHGLRSLPDPDRHALHHRRWHPRGGNAARDSDDKRRAHGHRDAPGVPGRHDGRRDGDDSPLAQGEPPPASPRAYRRLLHLPRGEHRRRPHTARRPAPLPRLPARGSVLLDAGALEAGLLRRRGGARGVRAARPLVLEPGAGTRARRCPGRG